MPTPSVSATSDFLMVVGNELQDLADKVEADISAMPGRWKRDVDAIKDELLGAQQDLARRLAEARESGCGSSA
jgi:hypothetical protein